MAKYFFSEEILAFVLKGMRDLFSSSELEKTESGTSKQGLTQKTSAIRHALAFDKLFHEKQTTKIEMRSLSSENGKEFVKNVGNIVSIGEGGLYTTNFIDDIKDKDRFAINNNLMSSGVVPKSEYEVVLYPKKRGQSLLRVDNYSFSFVDDYIDTLKDVYNIDKIGFSFLLWLNRFEEFESDAEIEDIYNILQRNIESSYSTEIAEIIVHSDLEEFTQFISQVNSPLSQFKPDLKKFFEPKVEELTSATESYYSQSKSNDIALLNLKSKGNFPDLNLLPLNLLFKGVPGTGKSFLIDKIITEHLKLEKNSPNVKRLNVHSASDNSTFMQGVGVALTGNSSESSITYIEKRGEVLKHLIEAIKHPNQPFVLVLEEIQENSLNELIGDLIYLIEPAKRINIAPLSELLRDLHEGDEFEMLKILAGTKAYSIQIPSLVEETDGLSLVFPKNLYVFCTTNYRDDKKIVEDNLMRRFDVIDLFPNTQNSTLYAKEDIRNYLERLNNSIINKLSDIETHPDRFLVGHSRFMKDVVTDQTSFCRALKKVLDEFKEIRDIEFQTFKEILIDSELKLLEKTELLDVEVIEAIIDCENYRSLAEVLQGHSGYEFL